MSASFVYFSNMLSKFMLFSLLMALPGVTSFQLFGEEHKLHMTYDMNVFVSEASLAYLTKISFRTLLACVTCGS